MTTRIFVAKFVPDPARWEPRNVGVIVLAGDSVQAKFLGEDTDGLIDGRSVRFSVGAPSDTYKEWVHYWRRTVIEERQDPAELPRVDGATFFMAKAGEVWQEQPAAIGGLVADYFSRLVRVEEENAGVEELKVNVERVLTSTGLAVEPAFKREVFIHSQNLARQETYRFAYGYQNGRMVVAHRVPLVLETYLHDALWRFGHIDPEIGKVAFVQGLDQVGDLPAAALLRDGSTVIDVLSPDVEDQTWRAFHAAAAA